MDASEAGIVLGNGFFEELKEFLDGVGTLEVDIATGVSSVEAGNLNEECDIAFGYGNGFVVESGCAVYATSATDVEFAFGLAVEVEECASLEDIGLEGFGTVHARFLIDGEERFECGMLEGVVSKDSHSRSYTHAIVRTKGGAIGSNPLAVDVRLDGVSFEIEVLVGVLLRHHVHVTLEDDTRVAFVTRSGGFADDDVADFVDDGFEVERAAIVGEEFGDFFTFAGRAGNLGEAVESFPNLSWLQI